MNPQLIGQLATLLIPIFIPVLIAGLKQILPKLPSWVLPILAPILGAVSATVSGVTDPGTGAVLGLAGIGVREIADQSKKAAVQAVK